MRSKIAVFKNIFNLYVFGNIHVAVAAFCLTKITLLEIGISDNVAPFFVFFATIASYNIIRFLRIDTIKSWFNSWNKDNRMSLYVITFTAILFLFYMLFKIRFKAFLVIFPFMLFTLLYVFPVKQFSLREKSGLKLFLIAVSWAGITVLFPLVQNYMYIRLEDWVTFLQRFLFVFAITIPFDIRDLKYDAVSMKTLPQHYGIKRSKQIAAFMLFLFFLLEFKKNPNYFFVIFLVFMMSLLLVLFSDENRNKYYTSFFIEGLPVLWLFFLLIDNHG